MPKDLQAENTKAVKQIENIKNNFCTFSRNNMHLLTQSHIPQPKLGITAKSEFYSLLQTNQIPKMRKYQNHKQILCGEVL